MAYDEKLADRIRKIFARRKTITEKRMFGGLAFLLRGNMCCGINGEDLMLRLGPEGAEKALRRAHAREMDFTGRPMKGFVYVAPAGVRTEASLRKWVEEAVEFASSLPAK